jgi:twitching motility protein PilT
MLANKLLPLLSRDDVSEIALQVGRPPCALVNNAYKPLSSQLVAEDVLLDVLAHLSGRENLLQLEKGCVWEHVAEVGVVRVRAAYDRGVLKAALKLVAPATAEKKGRASRRPPAASASDKPARASRRPPPAAPGSTRPTRASRRPSAPTRIDTLSLPVGPSDRGASKRPASAPFSNPPMASLPVTAGPPSVELIEEAVPEYEAIDMEPTHSYAQQTVYDPPPAVAPAYVRPAHDGDVLDDLMGRARELRATDLHVLADRPATLRIAAELVPQHDCVLDAATAEELILMRVPAAQHAALERDGSCDFSLVHPAYGRFRANVTRQRTGIKLTARPIGDHIPTLAELGLPESIARATHHHQGLIVITGPTGHGKTTTLAAIVGIINRETAHHVITVEDPIEYIHPAEKAVISQREVGTHTKSFQAALKGSLREDPDVIVVGELRDTETVRMALSASETGHLVISTMNTPSAAKAIERLIDLFPPGDQPQVRMTLAGGLRLIVSQRLLPNVDGTGLCAAAEVLPGNLPLWNLIRENRTYQIASLQQRGKALGIVRLDESLAALVRSGQVTMDAAREVAEAPEHIAALVQGRPIIQRPPEEASAPSPMARAAGQAANAAKNKAASMAAATPKIASDLGKQMMSRAGKLFGNDAK